MRAGEPQDPVNTDDPRVFCGARTGRDPISLGCMVYMPMSQMKEVRGKRLCPKHAEMAERSFAKGYQPKWWNRW